MSRPRPLGRVYGVTLVHLCIVVLAAEAEIRTGARQTSTEPTEVLGKRSEIRIEANLGWIRIDAGTKIHEQPNRSAGVLDIVAEPTDFEILEQREDWIRIQRSGWIGWILVGQAGEEDRRGIPIRYTPDEERLLRARTILGDGVEPSRLGPFELYSDLQNDRLLERMTRVAVALPDTYSERYGLDPGTEASEVLVVFSSYDDYLRFEAGEPDIAGTGTRGYTGRGISVLSVGERSIDQTLEILVHELTHVLNRRVFGMNSPAWVEEGLADDLAYCKVASDGRLAIGSLGGEIKRDVSSDVAGRYRIDFEVSGGRGMLSNLLARWSGPERPSLPLLLDMSWIEFIQPEVRPLHYAESAFFVRFLLGSKNKTRSQALLSYLQRLASAKIAQAESLWDYLDESPEKVEAAYYRWLRKIASANGL